jgi:YD repeat-containing protein
MGLVFQYDVDREYKFKYLKQMQETTPSGLTRNTLKDKTYEDLDSDDIPDVITETMTVNDKATTVVNNVAQSEKLVTSPAGRSVTTVYNPATLLISRLSVPGFHDTICQYDSRGRLKSMATHARETTLTYNAKGFLESITSPEGYTTAYSYDAVGRVLAVNRPDGSPFFLQATRLITFMPTGVWSRSRHRKATSI